MANLLPQKERKRFEWEYRFRFLTITLSFLAVTLLLGTVFLLPSYFVSNSKGESISLQSELLQKTITLRENDVSVMSLLTTKQKINKLVLVQEQVLQTEVLQTVIGSADGNIALEGFYYKHGENSEGEMKITGRAHSRSTLLSFSERLKKESLFSNVNLPVSSLAKDSNIVFSITLTGNF